MTKKAAGPNDPTAKQKAPPGEPEGQDKGDAPVTVHEDKKLNCPVWRCSLWYNTHQKKGTSS